MPGTKAGAARRRATMIARHGSEDAYLSYMRKIGRFGGQIGNTGGFASEVTTSGLSGRELARVAGKLGRARKGKK